MKRILFLGFAAVMFTACSKNTKLPQQLPDIDLDLPTLNTKAGNFATCDEVISWRNAKAAQWNYYNPPYDYGNGDTVPVSSPITGAPMSGSAPTGQPTNTQEVGIDEADILKTDGQRIFLARSHSVEIINQDTLALEQTLSFPMLGDLQLYYESGKLVVMGQTEFAWSTSSAYMPPPPSTPAAKYAIRIYERGSDGKFAPTSAQDFYGSLLGARLKDGIVTLVTTQYLDWSAQLYEDQGKINGVPCAAIQKPLIDDFSSNIAYIYRLPLNSPDDARAMARFGRVNQIYMGQDNLYLVANGYDWFWRDSRYYNSYPYDMLFVSKYALGTDATFQAAGMIRGSPIGQFSFHENSADELLYAIVGTYSSGNGGNALYTLAQDGTDLVLPVAPLAFSPQESLRAVRFVGDYAYAVTYHNVDPLEVFDLRRPRAPIYIGKLAVPGFSAYLHPLANGRLLGIGYADGTRDGRTVTVGLQVSLFDVTHPEAPAAITQQTYGDRSSYSAAVFDYHAFFIDEAARILALPANLYKRTYNPWGMGELEFSGAMILNPSAPSATYGKITHFDWIPEHCRSMLYTNAASPFDVSRVMKVGSSLITVSPFGARASDIGNSLATTHDLQFADDEAECTALTTYNNYVGY